MGIEIEPPVRLKSTGFLEKFNILEDGPIRKFLKEWKPLIPRKKFLLEFLERTT